MSPEIEEQITYERLGDIPEVLDDLEKAFVIGLLDRGLELFSFIDQCGNINDLDVRKALEDHENKTIRKFAKNLHPEEAKIIHNLLVKFQPYYERIVHDVAQLISGKKKREK